MVYDAEIFARKLSETFLLSRVQGLWQVASPLNLLLGHRDRLIVNHMVFVLLGLYLCTISSPLSTVFYVSWMAGFGLASVFDHGCVLVLASAQVQRLWWVFSLTILLVQLYYLPQFMFLRIISGLSWFFSLNWICSLDCIVFADCFLQQTTLFSSLFFYILDCIVFVSFWNSLDCNKVFCMVFISSWGDIYVMFNLIPAHFIVLSLAHSCEEVWFAI